MKTFLILNLLSVSISLLAFAEADVISSDARVLENNESTSTEKDSKSAAATSEKLILGAHFGPSFSNTYFRNPSGHDFGGTSTRTLLSGGVYVERPLLTEFIAWQLELDYVQRGFEVIPEKSTSSFKTGLNYLEVPLFLKANLPLVGTTISALAGPSIGYLMSGSYSTKTVDPVRGTVDRSGDLILDPYNRFSFGFNLGAMVGWSMTPLLKLTAGARYYWGMTNVQKAEVDPTTSSKTRAGQILFGAEIAI